MEAKLDEILREFRKGHREGSIISVQTIDSLSNADRKLWRSIRKELEDIGLSVAAFDANKEFIFSWLKRAMADGAFEEEAEDLDEVGSGSESGFPRSASTTRPTSRDRVTSGGRSMDTNSSSSPAHKARSGRTLKSSPRPFSWPTHSSVSLAKPAETIMMQSANSIIVDDEMASSPTSPTTHLKATGMPQKTHKPLNSHLNKVLSWVTTKDPGPVLINAINQGNTTEALNLLRSQSSIQSLTKEQGTVYDALFLAVHKGIPELLEPLLVAGQVGINDLDLLSVAVDYDRSGSGQPVTLEPLLGLGADPSLFGSNCVLRAIIAKDEYALRVLFDAGVDVNARVGVSRSIIPLHQAISIDASDTMVRMILNSGAEVNWMDPAGQTPLGVAITERRFDCVNVLISYGADFEKPTWLPSTGQRVSPLIGAAVIDESRIVKLLVDKGADINQHWSSLQVLDLFSLIRRRSLSGPILEACRKWLYQKPTSAVHAAVTYDLDATGMLKMLIQDGAQTDWKIALILAFLEREHDHIGKIRRWDNSQGALVAVLTKCSESRGISREFRSTDSQVFDVMAACIASTNEIQSSDDESLRSLVDEVISRCH